MLKQPFYDREDFMGSDVDRCCLAIVDEWEKQRG